MAYLLILDAILVEFGPLLRNSTCLWRTDRPTDRPTDRRTDTLSYRDARSHLKRNKKLEWRNPGGGLTQGRLGTKKPTDKWTDEWIYWQTEKRAEKLPTEVRGRFRKGKDGEEERIEPKMIDSRRYGKGAERTDGLTDGQAYKATKKVWWGGKSWLGKLYGAWTENNWFTGNKVRGTLF